MARQQVKCSFHIRPAAPSDVPTLLAMLRKLALEETRNDVIAATDEDWLRDGFGSGRRFAALVAEAQVGLVGMATFTENYLPSVGRTNFVISELYVDLAFRRNGIGQALLGQIAAAAIEVGVPALHLGVQEKSNATRFYRHIGFRPLEGYATFILGGSELLDLAATTATALSASTKGSPEPLT